MSTDLWNNNRKHMYSDDPEGVKDCEITHKSSQIMKMINPHVKMTNENYAGPRQDRQLQT